jgi:hypothetical protein
MMLCPVNSYYLIPPYPIEVFIADITELAVYMVSPAVCYLLWRIFVTNRMAPRGDVCVLGLSETSATRSEMYGRGIKWKMLALYASISWLTFNLGLMAFDFYYYCVTLLSTLLE